MMASTGGNTTTTTTTTTTIIGIVAAVTAIISSSLTYYYMKKQQQFAGSKPSSSSSSSTNESTSSTLTTTTTTPSSLSSSTTSSSSSTTALHKVDPILQKAGLAKIQSREAKPLSTSTPHKTNVVRIALTGGPCAGKSSSLQHIRQKATEVGFDVYTAPEIATILFNSGIQYPSDDNDIIEFQKSLCRIQLHFERNFTSIIERTGRPSILIFDRGLMDVKGYIPSLEMWNNILENLDGDSRNSTGRPLTEKYCYQRYTGVIHLVTAANGAPEYYKWGQTKDDCGNDVVRRENVTEAIELDTKMQWAWKGHPNHYIIKNEPGATFQDKLQKATNAILSLAEQTHPLLST